MPNTKSARKSLRVGERRNVENKKIKLNIRQVLKKASTETLPDVFKALDKAAKNHIIHENKAARLKSRISTRVANEAGEAKAEKPKKTAVKAGAKKTAVKKATAKKTVKKSK